MEDGQDGTTGEHAQKLVVEGPGQDQGYVITQPLSIMATTVQKALVKTVTATQSLVQVNICFKCRSVMAIMIA